MQVTSTDFQHLETIPVKFTAFGDNVSPALTFSEIPEGTESLVLILEDPDTPYGLFTHWVLYNMSPVTLQIMEGEMPISGAAGVNDKGDSRYFGPRPPAGTGSHRYMFKLFALDTMLDFPADTKVTRDMLYDAMNDHIIDETELIGMFAAEDAKH